MFTTNSRIYYFGFGCILASVIWTPVVSTCLSQNNTKRINMYPHHDFDGQVVTSLHVLWKRTDRDMVNECSADCYRDPRCRAFFYNKLTRACQGHFHSSLSIDDAVPQDGWLHYRYYQKETLKDCGGARSDGTMTVAPSDGLGTIHVFCDVQTGGGGWLVFQRRSDGSENFSRKWNDYKDGFGSLENEFWLGNDYIHRLTSQRTYTLRIDLKDFKGNKCWAIYTNFSVASEADKYKLTIGTYSGTCGNELGYHNACKFSTIDRDNDEAGETSCAAQHGGGWWFNSCFKVNLNGPYNITIKWNGKNFAFTEMKFRPSQ